MRAPWEYCSEWFDIGDNPEPTVARLGREGWELTAVVNAEATTVMWFKRRIGLLCRLGLTRRSP